MTGFQVVTGVAIGAMGTHIVHLRSQVEKHRTRADGAQERLNAVEANLAELRVAFAAFLGEKAPHLLAMVQDETEKLAA